MSRQLGISIEGVPDPSTLTVELLPDLFPVLVGVREPGTGHFLFDVPTIYHGGAHVRAVAPGFEEQFRRLTDAAGNDIPIPETNTELLPPMVMEPIDEPAPLPLPWLPRLVAAGRCLRQANGVRWTAIECTDFHLTGRALNGEDIGPVQTQRSTIGFNLRRLFSAYDIPNTIGVCKPKDHPHYYDDLALLMKACNDVGSYVDLVAFTGPYDTLFANDTEKIDHWEALIDMADGCPNVILSLVNEYTVSVNHDIPWDELRRPPLHIMASHGSNGSAARPPEPFWGFTELHTNNEVFEEQRKIGHNAMEIWKGPTLTTETRRWPDKTRRLDVVYGATRAGTLLCAGTCFHSVHGKNATLFTEGPIVNGKKQAGELEAAHEWVRGARSMTLACQNQGYRHRKDLEDRPAPLPDWLRVYQRGVSPDHIAEIVK